MASKITIKNHIKQKLKNNHFRGTYDICATLKEIVITMSSYLVLSENSKNWLGMIEICDFK